MGTFEALVMLFLLCGCHESLDRRLFRRLTRRVSSTHTAHILWIRNGLGQEERSLVMSICGSIKRHLRAGYALIKAHLSSMYEGRSSWI